MKGLVIIHEIHPKQGSECRSGYNFLKKIIEYCQNNTNAYIDIIIPFTNLFGSSHYYNDLVIDLQKLPYNVNIVPVKHSKLPFISNLLLYVQKKRGGSGSPIIYYFFYKIWLLKIRKVINDKNYNFIHLYNHINFFPIVDFSTVTKNWILGPVTGISDLPKSFRSSPKEFFRLLLQKYYLQKLSKFCNKINTVYAVSEADENFFNKCGVKNVIRLPEQCFDKVPDLIPKKFEKLKIIWIGELVSRKQLEILLQATSNLEIPYEIHIVGDGPLKLHYIKMAQKYNVNSKFYGKINRDEVFNLLKTSHVLAHTSYREGTATTILEALSMNNFVIAHKIGGQDLVVRSNGMILDLISFDYSVKMFSEQLTKLYYGVIDDKIKFNLSASNFLTWENLFNEILKSYL
jgi:hypothetical protein